MMKVGDYVRNQYGIAKVIDIENNYGIDTLVLDNNICFMVNYRTGEINKDIPFFNKLPLTKNIDLNKVKTSSNIIDLIEEGDYVNGERVFGFGKFIYDDGTEEICSLTLDTTISCLPEDIKSIVTHEQFEKMEYKL